MRTREKIIGIGILILLLALAGTVSAKHDGSLGFSCNNCHSAITIENASFYNQTHRYNETIINPPNCDICHESVAATPFSMKLNLKKGTPTYLTSALCENCHKAKYDNWTNTLHRVMLTPKDKAQAMGLPAPEVGWANISYVIVTKFQLAYINTTGYFPAKNDEYNTENMTWENSSHAGGAYGTCGRCHTTNWNASARNISLPGFNGTFSEPGIACERCHQPAGNGHQVVVNYSGDQCRECHTGGNHGTGWENGEHAPPPFENGSSCMFCHSSFDQYKNQNVTIANATGVSCGVCHNIHDMTDKKYAETFTVGNFNAVTWSVVADSKLSFFNATASIAAGTDIFDDLSNRLLYPGNDSSRKDASYGTAPINLTGRPVSEVLCSMCHYRHGIAHIAGVNLTHGAPNNSATCTDCHMGGSNATVGKDMMKNHNNDPLIPASCVGCHSSMPTLINEWKASAHNDKEVGVNKSRNYNGFYWNNTSGAPNSRLVSCNKCHSPKDWNPVQDSNTTNVQLTSAFNGITCGVCHNIHDMGEWLNKTRAAFGVEKPYAWYNKDAIVVATNATTGVPTRYKANYTMMKSTTELCGNCHSNIRIGNTGPGWASATAANPIGPHGFPAKDLFVGSMKESVMKFECTSCHFAKLTRDENGTRLPVSQMVRGHSFKVNATILMNGTACSSCHVTGSTLGNLSTTIGNIQAQTRDKWNATNATVLGALATIKAYNGEKNLSRTTIAQAYWNLRMVSSDESWGVHNPNATNKLLDDATNLANESIAQLGQAGTSNTLTVSPSTAMLASNGTQIFNAMAKDQNDTPRPGITIIWASNNITVGNVSPLTATTDVSGGATTTFTAGAAGIAMITANNGTDTGSANVTVTVSSGPPVLTAITVSPATVTLANNGTQIFNAMAKDQNGTPRPGITIIWTSNNTTVGNVSPLTATTDVSGGATTTFTAGTAGIAMITANNGTDSGSANVTVTTVTPSTNVTVAIRTIEKESLRMGGSTNITVVISSNLGRALSLRDIIPAGWNLTRVTDDADAFKSSTNEWVWFNVKPGINKTVIYRLTAPGNVSIGTYHINGTISSSSGVIAVVQGNNTITLDIIAFYRRLGSDYNKVETTDVLTAVEDWRNNVVPAGFERAISTQEVLTLVDEWIMS